MKTVLETKRLVLRELTPNDADALERVIGDGETMRFYLRPFTRPEVEEWIARNRERYATDGHGLWAVVLRESGEMIGDCGLVWQDVDGERLVEVAYHLHRAHWNRGYATEAARECMRYGFDVLSLPKIISLIRPENVASRRVAEKNGLRIERRTTRGGLMHDIWTMRREQWQKA